MLNFLRRFGDFFTRNSYVLIWTLVVLFGVVLISFYFVLLLPSLASIKEEMVSVHLEIARSSRDKAEQFLDENVNALNDLAQILDSVGEGQNKKIIIDRFLKERKAFVEITFVNRQGQEVLKDSQSSVFSRADLRDVSWSESFFLPKEGKVYLSPVYFSDKSEPLITVSLPVKSSPGSISGVLSAELSLKQTWDIVSTIGVGIAGRVYLVDSRGYLIAHPNIQLVLKKTNFLTKRAVEEVIIGKKTVLGLGPGEEYLNEKGESVYVVGLPLEKTGWGVFVEDPVKDAWAPYRAIGSLGLISILVTIIFSIVLFFGVWMLAGTLSDLKKSKIELEIKTGELQEAKEGLEIRVEARTKELQELAESLEGKVEERTGELQEKVKTLEKIQNLTIGRELKMVELKKEIKKLKPN